MLDVPLELLQSIANDLESNSALFQLRLVSKTLNYIATPLAFGLVTVRDSVKSAEGLMSLTDRERKDNGDEDQMSGEAGRKALKAAFSGLAKFPKLENLHFDFHDGWPEDCTYDIPQNPTHFLRLQFDLFASLAASPLPSLVSLLLNKVLVIPNAIYAQPGFQNVFRLLKTLHISVLSDIDYEGSYHQEPLADFWEKSVAHMVRSASGVTSLTIHSDQEVGAYPALSFKDTVLPHLSSLVLHNFVLDPMIPDSDVVAFILRHKATLAHLELHNASIDGGEDTEFPRLWHVVLTLFAAELTCLKTFVLTNDGREPISSAIRASRTPLYRRDMGI
ncbi:hypothetical protein C8R44DRAFT_746694 [Mycena epipterygia]|nr:hypothetical protein C8R44DRAFT_746694 [Mycena epipterygia]